MKDFEKYVNYYDINGQKITRDEWLIHFINDSYKIIANDQIGKFRISTVWLGMDHSFGFEGPLQIFETMVFDTTNKADTWQNIDMERYSTLEQAKAGHRIMVETYKNLISSSSASDSSAQESNHESQETC